MPESKRSLDEIAQNEDEHVASGLEADGLERVPGHVSPDLKHIIQVSLSSDELGLIQDRATASGMSTSEFIRYALLNEPASGRDSRRGA